MLNLKIHINGKVYDVDVEEGSTGGGIIPQIIERKPAPATVIPHAPAAAREKMAQATAPTQGESILAVRAGMPARVVSVEVEIGQSVHIDQELVIIEAMKMENSLLSDCDGVVSKINVKAGDEVQAGEILLEIT